MTVFPVGSAQPAPRPPVVMAPAPAPLVNSVLVTVHDATGNNEGTLPAGMAAGYLTGSDGIAWTAAQFSAHPGALRIDQAPSADVPTADVLDVEGGAAQPGSAPAWVGIARRSIAVKARIGQRILPVIYMSASNVTTVINSLTGAGIKHDVGLWVANFNLTRAEAESMVQNSGGPFPIVGVQFTDNPPDGTYDTSVFSAAYLVNTVDNTDWVHLVGIPADASVFYNQKNGTLGYNNSAGAWTKIKL